jgi:hypothetical protein
MAKKQSLDDIFTKTTQAAPDNSDLDEGNIKPSGVGLREGELRALDLICAELTEEIESSVSRNSLMRIAIRRLIEDVRIGKITHEELGKYFVRPERPAPRLKF